MGAPRAEGRLIGSAFPASPASDAGVGQHPRAVALLSSDPRGCVQVVRCWDQASVHVKSPLREDFRFVLVPDIFYLKMEK